MEDLVPRTMIQYDDFRKLDMRIGRIVSVERVPKTDRLYNLRVDVGREIDIVSSLVPHYTEEELLDRKVVVLINLEPATFAGQTSEGMLLCAENDDRCTLLAPAEDIPVGTKVT